MIVANRESIDIVELRKSRNLRRGMISPETAALMKRLRSTGQVLNVTLEGEVVGEIGPATTDVELIKLLFSYHPNVIEQLNVSVAKAKEDLASGKILTGLDVVLSSELKVVIDGTEYLLEEIAQEIGCLEERYDVDRENMEEFFSSHDTLGTRHADYVRFEKIYPAYLDALQ